MRSSIGGAVRACLGSRRSSAGYTETGINIVLVVGKIHLDITNDVPGTMLFERSESLIATSRKKKSARVFD